MALDVMLDRPETVKDVTLLTDSADEPIIAKQETFTAGWDAAAGTGFELPQSLIE
jgi:hypothetical protein